MDNTINFWKDKSIEDIDNEIWIKIPDFESYMASDLGRIKKINGYIKNSKRACDFIVAQFKDKKGYLRATMKKEDIHLQIQVHRIIAITFIPNPENKPQVNHKKGNKLDNRPFMLEWNSALENLNHAFENGLRILPKGENHHASKISDYYVIIIRRLYRINPDFNKVKVAEKFNCSKATIYNIIFNRSKKHLL